MKMLIAILALSASPVHAHWQPTPQTSFERLYRTGGIQVEMPKIIFHNWFVPAISVCVDGENLRTTSPVEHCTSWSNGEGSRCEKYESEFLYVPRVSSVERCASWSGERCDRYETHTSAIPTHYDVAVYHTTGGEQMKTLLFRKPLDLEECECPGK